MLAKKKTASKGSEKLDSKSTEKNKSEKDNLKKGKDNLKADRVSENVKKSESGLKNQENGNGKPAQPSPDKKTKVLIVEDNKEVLDTYIFSFKKPSFEVFSAKNLDSTLKTYEEHGPFDIILMDMYLDDSNGVEIIQKLKEKFDFQEPFIYVSGEPNLDIIIKSIETRPSAYVLKPVRNRDLISKVHEVVDNHMLHQNKCFKLFVKNNESIQHYLEYLGNYITDSENVDPELKLNLEKFLDLFN